MTRNKRMTKAEPVGPGRRFTLHRRFGRLREAARKDGIVTTKMAAGFGISRFALAYHERKLHELIRVGPGRYHFVDQPPASLGDHVRLLAHRYGGSAVASHETALRLHNLSDVNPPSIDFTVPRSQRSARHDQTVRIHTTSHPIPQTDLTRVDGVLTTTAARSIIDAARAGTGPEQIQLAVSQALQRGLAKPRDFVRLMQTAPSRVHQLINSAITEYKNQ